MLTVLPPASTSSARYRTIVVVGESTTRLNNFLMMSELGWAPKLLHPGWEDIIVLLEEGQPPPLRALGYQEVLVDHLRRQALELTLEDDEPTQLLAVHEASRPRASRVRREQARARSGRPSSRETRENSPRKFSPRFDPPLPPPKPTPGSNFSGITVPLLSNPNPNLSSSADVLSRV